jgi:hypothetical protein
MTNKKERTNQLASWHAFVERHSIKICSRLTVSLLSKQKTKNKLFQRHCRHYSTVPGRSKYSIPLAKTDWFQCMANAAAAGSSSVIIRVGTRMAGLPDVTDEHIQRKKNE